MNYSVGPVPLERWGKIYPGSLNKTRKWHHKVIIGAGRNVFYGTRGWFESDSCRKQTRKARFEKTKTDVVQV